MARRKKPDEDDLNILQQTQLNSKQNNPKQKSKTKQSKSTQKQNNQEQLTELSSISDIIESMYVNEYNSINVELEDLNRWLKNHIYYNRQLRNLSELLYNAKGIYSRSVNFMVNILPLDYVILCDEQQKAKYKEYQKKILKFIDDIKFNIVIRDILFKVMLYGTYFGYVRDSKAIQPLDLDYTKIVRIVDMDFQLAFNMSYFDKFSDKEKTDQLNSYPSEFKQGYVNYLKDRVNNMWFSLDINKTITIKAWCRFEDIWGRPLGMAAFDDLLYDNALLNTDRVLYEQLNRQLIHQKLGDMSKDSYHPIPDQQRQAHESVRSVLTDNTKKMGGLRLLTTPFYADIKAIDINTDILQTKKNEESLNRVTADLGISLAILNGTKGTYSGETFNVEAIASQVYAIIEWIEEYLFKKQFNILVPSKYFSFKLKFFRITNLNRQDFVDNMKGQLDYGGSLGLYVSAMGIPSEAYGQILDEENQSGIKDKLVIPETAFTQSGNQSNDGGDSESGRPKKKNKDKKDNALRSDDAGQQPNTPY